MKILGSILILCACISSSLFYEKKQKEKIEALINCCDFIKYIKSQIEFFLLPLDKIYLSYKDKNEYINKFICGNYDENISIFDKDDFEILKNFFSSIGKGMKKNEISLCEYVISELEKNIEKKKAEYPNKIKVFRIMALFFGFCIVILLI